MNKYISLPFQSKKHWTRASALFWSGICVGSIACNSLPAQAQVDAAGSVTVAKHANKAAEYWDKGDYARAKEEYRAVIGFVPDSVEYYEGLLNCSEKTNDWQNVVFAADKIASLSPERKKFYDYDFGMALFNLNRYDEAIPHLKAALATADIPVPPFKPMRLSVAENTTSLKAPEILPTKAVGGMPSSDGEHRVAPGMGLTATQIQDKEDSNIVTSKNIIDSRYGARLQNFDNAIRSESIVLAEYQGYDKNADIRFNSPPLTHWHIEKILKGPPLNKSLPLRFDFHTPDVNQPPPGWKFDEAKMPTVGSKYIIFIEFAVPDGVKKWFLPFLGAYGVQPATDDNLNTLDRLLEEHNMRIQGL
jgi:hypothetical protein